MSIGYYLQYGKQSCSIIDAVGALPDDITHTKVDLSINSCCCSPSGTLV